MIVMKSNRQQSWTERKSILTAAWKRSKKNQASLLGAGTAFFAFMALFPTMIAAILLYGLVADPQTISEQVDAMSSLVPAAALELIQEQLTSLASANQQGLGLGLIIALAVALWSASGGMNNMITAVNAAYECEDQRGFIKSRLLALGMTAGAILLFIVMVGLLAIFPLLLGDTNGLLRFGLEVLRWSLLLAAFVAGIGLLYRIAPDRQGSSALHQWLSMGTMTAVVIWVLASVGFSIYTSLGSYGSSYGALAGVVVLLLWMYYTAYAILLGAEINAESERRMRHSHTLEATDS